MQVPRINSQPCLKNNQQNFKGIFVTKDPKVLDNFAAYSEDLYYKLTHLEGTYLVHTKKDSVLLKSLPEDDVKVFQQLKELGIKFKAKITNNFE